MFKIPLLILALSAAGSASAAEPKTSADWTSLAQCAGAYRANAQIKDPNRAPSMRVMISDQADMYVSAAVKRHRQVTKSSTAQAKQAVDAVLLASARRFGGMSRDALDKVIDGCPQPEDRAPALGSGAAGAHTKKRGFLRNRAFPLRPSSDQ